MLGAVPDEGGYPEQPRPWPLGRALAAIGVIVLAVLVIVGAAIRLPYVLILPGGARPLDDLIALEGATRYPPKGRVLYTTVSLRERVNVFAALWGWLKDDVAVVPERDITGGKSEKQVVKQNRQDMDISKLDATRLALEKVGYHVTVRGAGARVEEVARGKPADGRLKVGDVITAVDRTQVHLHSEAVTAVRSHKPGQVVHLAVRRGTSTLTVDVPTVASDEGQAQMGVVLTTDDERFEFPFKVTIDTGAVGGPSAGLAFTLALIDELSPGELTGGRIVAVTGTVDETGLVGPIGGIEEKAVAARKAGAVAFIVPTSERAAAQAHAGRMKVIPVDTLDDALAGLVRMGGDRVEASAPPR